jgi:histidine triad (HIT) family protein
MKEDKSKCIFCKIIAGKAPASIVYEDDKVLVFPVLKPVNKGHLIIVPKKHAPYLADLDEKTTLHVVKIARKLAAAIRKSKYKCDGINLFLADGEAAEQEIFHFHLHVYPRYRGDGFGFKYNKAKNFLNADRKELDEVAKEIKKRL